MRDFGADFFERQLASTRVADELADGGEDAVLRKFRHGLERLAERQIEMEADIGVEAAAYKLMAERRPARTGDERRDGREPPRLERLENPRLTP